MPRLLTYPRASARQNAAEPREPAGSHEDGEEVVSLFTLLESAWHADDQHDDGPDGEPDGTTAA